MPVTTLGRHAAAPDASSVCYLGSAKGCVMTEMGGEAEIISGRAGQWIDHLGGGHSIANLPGADVPMDRCWPPPADMLRR